MISVIRNAWCWAGLDPAEIVGTNAFGNYLVRATDGTFWRICPEELTCEKIADDESTYSSLLNDEAFITDWEMKRLVELAAWKLGAQPSDRCFCLKMPGALGGKYVADNVGTISRAELLAFTGDIARQIKDVPDDGKIGLKISRESTGSKVMKAIVQIGYGSAGVLKLDEIETPSIGERDVLIKVHAASVNALDWHITRGKPYFLRLLAGLRAPRDRIRGVDVAGTAQAVGKGVTRIKPGDDVFGGCDGSFAEYAVTTEDRLATKPLAVSWEQAATLNVAGLTALQGLRDRAQLRPGQSLLVVGAGGGVGTFAVQIGKWLGARVTAVTRAERIELVRSMGADDVLDHSTYDLAVQQRFDVVFDISGNRPMAEYRRVMAPRGILVAVGGPAGNWFAPADRMVKAIALSPFMKQRFAPFVAKPKHQDLALLAELVQSGVVVPAIDQRYSLLEAASAVAFVGAGRARGKVIIRISGDEAK